VVQRNANAWFAYATLGVILAKKGKLDEAIAYYRAALKIRFNYAECHANLGRALMEKGLIQEAVNSLRTAVEFDAADPANHLALGNALYAAGMSHEAMRHWSRALELDPRFVDARLMLGNALADQGQFKLAAEELQKATSVNPNNLRAVNDLAWLLAVCPNDEVRDGLKAVQLAQRVCAVTRRQDPVSMTTLAAAYAELGEFSMAIVTATKALDLASPQDHNLLQRIQACLEHYRIGKPYRRWP
jgi:tetratricopeptide (TPR) repeat protein